MPNKRLVASLLAGGMLFIALITGAALLRAERAGGRQTEPAPSPSAAQSTRSQLGKPGGKLAGAYDKLAKAVLRKGDQLGVTVVDVVSGEVLFERGGAASLNPASNMKLVTIYAALKQLGPNHRYLTGLYGRLKRGRVATLVLRGQGDPSLERRHLWELAARLKRAGTKVIGDLVVDQRAFDAAHVPPTFGQQPNEWASFRAPVAAVSLAGNVVVFEIRPREVGQSARVSVVPRGFVRLAGRVKTSEPDAPEAVQLSLKPHGKRLAAKLRGSLPSGSPTLRIYRRVDDPALLAGQALRDIFEELGVKVEGEIRLARKAKRLPLLSAYRSPPLAVLLRALGKKSNNFYAEMVFKSLSLPRHRQRGAEPASFERSAELVRQLLVREGLGAEGLEVRNGSGLFDGGATSTRFLAKLLAAGLRDPSVGPEMVSALAIGGYDGTLRHRFRRWRDERSIRGKTGTLAGVSALSGYVMGSGSQPTVAFSVVANVTAGRAVKLRRPIDRFVGVLAAALAAPSR